ncbi:MAG: P-loop NTPase [Lentisphaeria bacterium]|nr:P-loop NTPase [Lentisphaeria bacterium]
MTMKPMDEAGRRQEQLDLEARMEQIGRKILVLSGKGGVGKSTVAANLAMFLARTGREVGLLDVDLHGPSIPKLLGLADRRLGSDAAGGSAPIRVGKHLSVVSVGLLLDSAVDAVIWRGPMKYNVNGALLLDSLAESPAARAFAVAFEPLLKQRDAGAEVILAGGMGQRAQELFSENGIRVVVGAPSRTPEEVVASYLDGTLQTGQNVCDH